MISSHSNQGTNNLTESFHKKNPEVKIVKIGSSRVEGSKVVTDLSMDKLLKDKLGDQYLAWAMPAQIADARIQIIAEADVVFATCTSAGLHDLRRFWFHVVLVDEATVANKTDTLIPMTHGVRALVLIGDDKQLPAIVHKLAKEMGYDISAFERICTEAEKYYKRNGNKSLFVEFNMQFRYHAGISNLATNMSYEGRLMTGVKDEERPIPRGFSWPNPKVPVCASQW